MPRKPGSRIRNYQIEPSTNQFGPKAVNPHSPWQLLVENTREANKISLRKAGKIAEIHPGTLYNWLRSKRGCPTKSIYTPEINQRLADALGLSSDELAEAYEASATKPVANTKRQKYGFTSKKHTMRQYGIATVIAVNKRGSLTLPPELRRKFGFDRMDNPLVIIEERDGELLLRPAAAVPVRDLPKNVIEGWIADDEAGMREFEAAKPEP